MILGIPIDITSLEIDEVQHLDLSYVVKKKAEAAYEKIGKPLFVDDVALYIEAWSGFPGPFIKYILEAGGNKLLTRMLENERNRKVMVKSAMLFMMAKKFTLLSAKLKGNLLARQEPAVVGVLIRYLCLIIQS